MALPISPSVLALFIAYLFDLKYAPSTVNTYVSAIGYSHRLSGLPDPTRVFYILQILKGYGTKGFRLDSRLPITLPILNRIIEASAHIAGSRYQICQFKAMCSLAFFAFLRIGELTVTTSNNQPLQMHQLSQLYDTNNQVKGIKLTFGNFKHNYNQRPFSLEIYRQTRICPVQLLMDYLVLRGSRPGAIFISHLGNPVSRDAFATQLKRAFRHCGLDTSKYKSHSLEIERIFKIFAFFYSVNVSWVQFYFLLRIGIILICSAFSTGDRAILLSDHGSGGAGCTQHTFSYFMKQSRPLARAVAYILYVCVIWIIAPPPANFFALDP